MPMTFTKSTDSGGGGGGGGASMIACRASASAASHPGDGWVYMDFTTFDINVGGFSRSGSDFITVPVSGVYAASGSFVATPLPAQPVKFILDAADSENNGRTMTRGFVELPNIGYWGTSGSVLFSLSAGQSLRFRMFLANSNGNAPLGVSIPVEQWDFSLFRVG